MRRERRVRKVRSLRGGDVGHAGAYVATRLLRSDGPYDSLRRAGARRGGFVGFVGFVGQYEGA